MKKRFLLFLLLFISLFMIGCNTNNNNTDDNNDTNNDDNPTFILNYITATEKLVEIEVDSVYLVPVDYDGVGDYSDLTFEFDNEGIISIEEGEIIGLVPGVVNVKVVSKYNVEIFDTFTVFVNTKGFKKSSLRLSTPTNTLIVGNSFNVTVANLSSVNATSDNEFIYTETPDQTRAINLIKQEMEKKKPMDMLLCGDVGYGKTEVAFRAIFKAINDGKQVAYLCPTTILSNQQYESAKSRFSTFPVNIGLINRFVDKSKQTKVLEDLKERDFRDMNREISPLVMCEDAYLIDTSFNSVNDCINLITSEMVRRGLLTKEDIQDSQEN